MSADDDQIRRALTPNTPPGTAHAALRETLPSMRRARQRRRVAVGAVSAALLVSTGAGVFALTANRDRTTSRTVTSDQIGQILPTVTEAVTEAVASSTTVSTSVAAPEEARTAPEPSTTATPTPEPPDDGSTPTDSDETIAPAGETPPPVIVTPVMPDPTDPPGPVSPPSVRFQTITSACGDVVVSIDAGTVRIATITARPGFEPEVSDDGPNSIEMTFRGGGGGMCELHAELKWGELDVEVQSSDTEP